MIAVVGLSHKKAPIEVRERLAVPRAGVPDLLARLVAHRAIGEAVVLSTCNRVEIYAAARGRAAGEADLAEATRLLRGCGALDDTFERARLFGQRAIDALGPFPAGRAKAALTEAVEFAIARAY